MSGGNRATQNDWVRRVLGVDTAGKPAGVVAYAKLQLQWREAQQRADASLKSFGAAVLAMKEVQADPRFAKVAEAIKGLPSLVPTFGDELADNLDAATNAGPGEPAKPHLKKALATLAKYRGELDKVPQLTRLAQFGKRAVGVDVTAYDDLDAALASIEREVMQRAA